MARKGTDAHCTYCGAEFPVAGPEPPAAPAPRALTRAEEIDARFGALESHPDAQKALRTAPLAAPTLASSAWGAVIAVVMIFGAITVMGGGCDRSSRPDIRSISVDGVRIPVNHGPGGVPDFIGIGGGAGRRHPGGMDFGILGVLVVGVIGLVVVKMIATGMESGDSAAAETTSWPARVADSTTETRGYGDSARHERVLILERRDRSRSHFKVPRRIARTVSPDDMGIAHTRGNTLVGFHRVDV